MKYFEKDDKYNWVDENNVFLGYDSRANCCESFGWFVSDNPRIMNEDDARECDDFSDWEGWIFDPEYKCTLEPDSNRFECATTHSFRISRGEEMKYLHIFNVHNGYYSHGFKFMIGDVTKLEGYI